MVSCTVSIRARPSWVSRSPKRASDDPTQAGAVDANSGPAAGAGDREGRTTYGRQCWRASRYRYGCRRGAGRNRGSRRQSHRRGAAETVGAAARATLGWDVGAAATLGAVMKRFPVGAGAGAALYGGDCSSPEAHKQPGPASVPGRPGAAPVES